MARSVYSPKLNTRTARARLPARKEPFWAQIAPNFHLGYYKGAQGSAWIMKLRDPDGGKRYMERLEGVPDDTLDPDGVTVITFEQAQAQARMWRDRKIKALHGEIVANADYTVAMALADYVAARQLDGAKPGALKKTQSSIDTRIAPELGSIPLAKLRKKQVQEWFAGLAGAAKLRRPGKDTQKTQAIDPADEQGVRARRATANRSLTNLKAALNHAMRENKVADDSAWRAVKPFRNVDAPKIHWLNADERRRLLNACEPDFRQLVHAALVTGCRYSELTSMRASQFEQATHVVTIHESKSGKGRNIALNKEGVALFEKLTASKTRGDRVFLRADGAPWGASHQKRRLEEASDHAAISPRATFHSLRHTYASALAMSGVPMGVIAAQLGHADTRMTEKHYAHLSPNYVADTVRAHLPDMGGADVEPGRVVKLGR